MNRFIAVLLLLVSVSYAQGAPSSGEKQRGMTTKLEDTIRDVDRRLDGYLGVAILDLNSGDTIFYHADEVFPTASTIKVALLAEMYRQVQAGKIDLNEIYTVRK